MLYLGFLTKLLTSDSYNWDNRNISNEDWLNKFYSWQKINY